MKKLSIIIVEYFCLDDVRIAIDSVFEHLAGIDFHIIVVSNSEYPSDTRQSVLGRFSNVNFIFNQTNSGYAGGVNRGLEESAAEYVFLLNPDGRFADNHFASLLNKMDNNPAIGILGPKVVDDAGVPQPSRRRFPKPYTFLLVRSVFRFLPGASAERRRYLMEDIDSEQSGNVDWVSGGAMLVRGSLIQKIGGMDERYFLYMEDVDWCKRAHIAGYEVNYDPSSAIIHSGQHASIGKGFIASLANRQTRWHFQSMCKYFFKFGFFVK